MAAGKQKYYLTTPIYYTNGLPHIGHTYSTIVCDTIRRYKRMRGFDVVMTTGTDEHGVNVERSAKKAGIPESEFVAKMAAQWKALWDELGVQGDEFIRTTDLKHAHTVQWLFQVVPGEWVCLSGALHGAVLHLRQCVCGCEAGGTVSGLRAAYGDGYRGQLSILSFRLFRSRF